ncbi:hypothetical protein HPS57_01485 [Prevotella sp. PINT]|uniref:hypothetical protein n=1 Tax=Palleniella intestinalis TaxID=2736291 RepID=UPI001555DA93|nr:hypothetical protein [Palleniella intestinalis]NPD80659.1 hypothetical protein [Palleniella intestinalis]
MRIRLIALVILATYPFLMAIAEENICDSIRQDSIIMRKAQTASATENTEAQTPQKHLRLLLYKPYAVMEKHR